MRKLEIVVVVMLMLMVGVFILGEGVSAEKVEKGNNFNVKLLVGKEHHFNLMVPEVEEIGKVLLGTGRVERTVGFNGDVKVLDVRGTRGRNKDGNDGYI